MPSLAEIAVWVVLIAVLFVAFRFAIIEVLRRMQAREDAVVRHIVCGLAAYGVCTANDLVERGVVNEMSVYAHLRLAVEQGMVRERYIAVGGSVKFALRHWELTYKGQDYGYMWRRQEYWESIDRKQHGKKAS